MNNKARDYIEGQVKKGVICHDDMLLSDSRELLALLYSEGSNLERLDWLAESDSIDSFTSILSKMLSNDNLANREAVSHAAFRVITESISFRANEIFADVIDDFENEEYSKNVMKDAGVEIHNQLHTILRGE